jgi:hypothetical protein
VDYSNESFVIDESNKSADIWPEMLASFVNERASLHARAGDPNLSPQYTPVFDATANVVDTIHDNVVVQLKLNGQDFTSALVSETAPAITYGNSAPLPMWSKRLGASAQGYFVYFSNVSQADVNVRLDLITQDGTPYLESSESGADFNLVNNIIGDPTLPAGANLAAQNSGYLTILARGAREQGFGHISWTSTQCVDAPLIAHGARYWAYSDSVTHSMVPVNNGNPF